MSDKVLFVMDMPKSCDTCVFSSIAYDSELFDEGECYCIIKMKSDGIVERCKPGWCPLKPVPEKPGYPPFHEESYVSGWNACIDKILEGSHNGYQNESTRRN